jgi:hypothetical protein
MVVEGPMFSMREKHAAAKAREVPGPGAYNPSVDDVKKQASVVFTRSGRGKEPAERAPGPGKYIPPPKSVEGPKFSFGKAGRAKDVQTEPTDFTHKIPSSIPNIPKYYVRQ